MNTGRYTVRAHNHGFFRLDGGAMFGSVPKALWSRVAPADPENRILLATRSLVVQSEQRILLIDAGCGDKWTPKEREIYGLEAKPYTPVPGVTDLLLTHLHFDHAGGISRLPSGSNRAEPCYPNATHHVSTRNLENAKAPNPREKSSYLAENIEPLSSVELNLLEPGRDPLLGLELHQSDSHTRGLLWATLTDEKATIAFPSDLVPTSAHLPVLYVMGYDACAETAMREKEEFLSRAIEGSWIVVFQHDPVVAAGRLARDGRGRPYVAEEVDIS